MLTRGGNVMPQLEFWFDFASTYSYVGAGRIGEEAARAGVQVAWRPFLLGPIFTAQLGIKDSPFNVQQVRGRYMWRDVERLCAKYGLPWKLPTQFPRNGLLAARVGCVAGDAPWVPDFYRAVFRANFVEDRDISDPSLVEQLLRAAGQDGAALVARASSPDAKQALRDRGDEAVRAGIFGAPNFLVRGELFFGQDRLEDAIAWAMR
jgi:2-hydroxychromene-2-carboxylate isomerase